MVDNDRVAAALPSYEVGSELGRGACGVVLAGQHRQLGRLVAIKQLPRAFGADPAVRARFLAEARVLATLDHPHVVAIYDFVDQDGLCLLVMERLTGGTVWSRFHAGGFTPDVSCAILLAVCSGLHHAHQHGILHRDVKPENLMFSGAGTLKVTDLGIAKVIGGSSTLATRHGEILGTPAYIAPEQAQGYELTPATDVYAAGTLLYELLAGRLPFPADSDPATLLYRHVHEAPPPLIETAHAIPIDLAEVTDRAISKSPADRYQSAEAFGVAIAECAAKAWGRGWLGRTQVPVSASGPILTAALGEALPGERTGGATAVESAQPTNTLDEPVAGDFLPIQLLHPELRTEDELERPPEVAPRTSAAQTLPPQSAPLVPVAPGEPAPATIAPPAASSPAATPAPASVGGVIESSAGAPGTVVAPGGSGPSLPSLPAATGGRSGGGSQRSKRRPVLLAIVALVVVGALVGGAVALLGGGGGTPPARVVTLPPPNLWKTLPSSPVSRQQVASAVTDDGTLWVIGGLTGASTATNLVESYDTKSGDPKWKPEPALPITNGLHHAMAVAYDGGIVVMGGWEPGGASVENTISPRVLFLDVANHAKSWVYWKNMNYARAAGAAAVVNNNIIVAGGQATSFTNGVEQHTPVPQTEMYQPGPGSTQNGQGDWRVVASMPTPRDHLAGVSDQGLFYAVGGRTNFVPSDNQNEIDVFDPSQGSDGSWTKLTTPLPWGMSGLAATVIDHEIVIAGGELKDGVSSEVEAYNIEQHTWSPLPPLKTARHGLALLSANNVLYAVDGAHASGHTHSVNANEALDLSSFARPGAWIPRTDTHSSRDQIAAAVVDGEFYIAGGRPESGRVTDETQNWKGDASGSVWSPLLSLPTAVRDATGVGYQDDFVVLGGWKSAHGKPDTISDGVYEWQGSSWSQLAHLRHARAGAAAAVVGDDIVVFGGEDAKHRLVRQTEVYDGKRWHDAAQMPTLRDDLAGASDDHQYVYAVGGLLANGTSSGAVERYDTLKDKWQPLVGLPIPRSGLGAAIVGDDLVVAGGEQTASEGRSDTTSVCADLVCGDLEALDFGTKRWSVLSPMPTPRTNFAFLGQGSNLYAIDGSTAAPESHPVSTNDLFRWSTQTP